MYTYIYIYLNPRTQLAFCLEYHSIIIRSHQSPINHSQSRINLLHRRLVQSQICILIVSIDPNVIIDYILEIIILFFLFFSFSYTYSVASVCKFLFSPLSLPPMYSGSFFGTMVEKSRNSLSRTDIFHNAVSSSSQIYQHPTVRCIAVICGRKKVECFFVFFFFFWQHCSDWFDCVICYLWLIRCHKCLLQIVEMTIFRSFFLKQIDNF